MSAAFHVAWVVYTRCPGWESGVRECSIPLTHQSPAGIYKGQQYRPMGIWPATFLCLRHGAAGLYSSEDIHLNTEPVSPE
jgi:hypothetical protein